MIRFPIIGIIYSISSSGSFWNALAGGCNIFVLAASLIVAGPRVPVGASGVGAAPRPDFPSLLTSGICGGKEYETQIN